MASTYSAPVKGRSDHVPALASSARSLSAFDTVPCVRRMARRINSDLEARVARAAYYPLVELCVEREIEGRPVLGVWSDGVFFPFDDSA